MSDFKYRIGQHAVLVTSLPEFQARNAPQPEPDKGGYATLRAYAPIEEGEITGRAEYGDRPNAYWIRYRAGDGRQVQDWFDEAAIRVTQVDFGDSDRRVIDIDDIGRVVTPPKTNAVFQEVRKETVLNVVATPGVDEYQVRAGFEQMVPPGSYRLVQTLEPANRYD